jgi:hypothetical protein
MRFSEVQVGDHREYPNSLDDEKASNKNTIEFNFKKVDIAPLRRYQLFTFTEFLAHVGMLLQRGPSNC